MAIQDACFNFASQQSLSGTAAQNSTNVYDAGSAKLLFGGSANLFVLAVEVTAAGGTSPTFRAQLVGADDAALSSNVITIAETGVSKVLAASDLPVLYRLSVNNQTTSKRYYGVIFTQSGTSPTATANAQFEQTSHDNLTK
jgi:hypothetical protein